MKMKEIRTAYLKDILCRCASARQFEVHRPVVPDVFVETETALVLRRETFRPSRWNVRSIPWNVYSIPQDIRSMGRN